MYNDFKRFAITAAGTAAGLGLFSYIIDKMIENETIHVGDIVTGRVTEVYTNCALLEPKETGYGYPSWTGYLEDEDYAEGCEDLTCHLRRGSTVRAKVTGSNDSYIFLSCIGV